MNLSHLSIENNESRTSFGGRIFLARSFIFKILETFALACRLYSFRFTSLFLVGINSIGTGFDDDRLLMATKVLNTECQCLQTAPNWTRLLGTFNLSRTIKRQSSGRCSQSSSEFPICFPRKIIEEYKEFFIKQSGKVMNDRKRKKNEMEKRVTEFLFAT